MQPSHSSPPQPLASRTNVHATRSLKVHFKLPLHPKASPTVSVTSTNAAARLGVLTVDSPCLEQASNTVSFPSEPIPISSRKRALSEDGYEAHTGDGEGLADGTKGIALPFHRRVSHIDIFRRRSKSCLTATPRNAETQTSQTSSPVAFPSTSGKPTPSVSSTGARRRNHRRESMSAGTPLPPAVKHPRKARRIAHDAHFLASMHSSIALNVHARSSDGAGSAAAAPGQGLGGPRDPYAAQDAVLAERIWANLVHMGYRPVPPPSPAEPQDIEMADAEANADAGVDPVREAAERAARRTKALAAGPLPQDLPTPHGAVPVPQLVATLIMRHRERAATRPRSAAKRVGPQDSAPRPSPLSTTHIPNALIDC